MNSIIKLIDELKNETPQDLHHHLEFVKLKIIERQKKNTDYKREYYNKNIEKQREYMKKYQKKKKRKDINIMEINK